MEFLYECAASAAIASIAGNQPRLLSLCRRLRERCADARAAAELEERALSEAEAYASKEQVRHNRFLPPRALREYIKNVEKTAAICSTRVSGGIVSATVIISNIQMTSMRAYNFWLRLLLAITFHYTNKPQPKNISITQKNRPYIGVNDQTKIVIRLKQSPDEP